MAKPYEQMHVVGHYHAGKDRPGLVSIQPDPLCQYPGRDRRLLKTGTAMGDIGRDEVEGFVSRNPKSSLGGMTWLSVFPFNHGEESGRKAPPTTSRIP